MKGTELCSVKWKLCYKDIRNKKVRFSLLQLHLPKISSMKSQNN